MQLVLGINRIIIWLRFESLPGSSRVIVWKSHEIWIWSQGLYLRGGVTLKVLGNLNFFPRSLRRQAGGSDFGQIWQRNIVQGSRSISHFFSSFQPCSLTKTRVGLDLNRIRFASKDIKGTQWHSSFDFGFTFWVIPPNTSVYFRENPPFGLPVVWRCCAIYIVFILCTYIKVQSKSWSTRELPWILPPPVFP